MKEYEVRKDFFFKSLNESYDYLCDTLDVEKNSPISSWSDISNYYKASDMIEEDDINYEGIISSLKDVGVSLPKQDIKLTRITKDNILSPKFKLLSDIYKKPDEDQSDLGTYKFGPFIGSEKDYELEFYSLNRAIELLRVYSPDYYHKSACLIEEIIICGKLEGGFMRSSTSVKCFGCVINTAMSPGNTGQYIEDIVHESAHLELYLVQLEDPLVLNDKDARYSAPFRPDARPMYGIYHAMYVLGHICKCLNDLKKISSVQNEIINLDFLIDRARSRFDESYGIVNHHGILTDKGRNIKESIYALVNS
ncbi:aKG-HExxH-type peptide beta-hydroxylase [Vibrio caribbeanicus]|uniref:aKG-HExxH-type peptide beta-hydroxylase n=1 Tax=Vibrio caribbeanicus TaxID=701175 RepID=UPI0030DD5153